MNIVPYNIAQAICGTIGMWFFWFRSAARFPSDAAIVPTSAKPSPRTASADDEKFAISDQNTSTTPATPSAAAKSVKGLIGAPKKNRMPRMFQNTMIENTTATRPEVSVCSEM